MKTDYDSPWKEILERYFRQFMSFFFPEAHADIDWEAGYQFLDKELERVVRDAELKRRVADKLVKVCRRQGQEAWVLIHVEVQGQRDPELAERMYVYNYRIFDRYRQHVVSFAILTDEQPRWRPGSFDFSLWGCKTGIWFPAIKLLDFEPELDNLGDEISNPFAVVVEAHLRSKSTRDDPSQRLQWKTSIVKGLYRKGLSREDILELFRFIDWVMVLPEDLEKCFREDLYQFEETRNMRYVTSVERSAIQRGKLEGRLEGKLEGYREGFIEAIEVALSIRFGADGYALMPEVYRIEDVAMLKALKDGVRSLKSIDDIRRLIRSGLPEQP